MAHHSTRGPPPEATTRGFFGVFRYSRRAMDLVWTTNRRLTVALAVLTLLAGVLPAAMAWVGALIIDAVIAAAIAMQDSGVISMTRVFTLVAIEAAIVAALTGAQRGISLCQALLRAQLGQRVNVIILEKALTLELAQFEDAEFYDKLTRARREASSRPLSLVKRTFGRGCPGRRATRQLRVRGSAPRHCRARFPGASAQLRHGVDGRPRRTARSPASFA
ncbi:MAG: hypothetical protein V3S21_09790, partial [Xanthomonadales bacterium]